MCCNGDGGPELELRPSSVSTVGIIMDDDIRVGDSDAGGGSILVRTIG